MNVSVTKRRIEKMPSVKTEKPADKPKDEEKAHEYFDPGNHWCRVCNHISTNIFDLFSHLHTKKHQQVCICVCVHGYVYSWICVCSWL